MKTILLILLTLFVNFSFGQTEKSTHKIVTENFVKYYNLNNYNAIFSMFSEEMKKTLPIDSTTQFLTGLKSQAGNITNREFLYYNNESYASYKTIFDHAILALNISIDDNSKINGFSVKPYIEESPSKTVINNLSNLDTGITKKQSEIIFNYVKDFPNQTQIAFALIKNGNVSYYGLKLNNDTLTTKVNYKSVFEIGSITKVFTSTLLANFVIDKKVKLNDNVNDYLNVSFNNDTKISFKHLANHTSNLPRIPTNLDLAKVDFENPYKEYKNKELVEYLTKELTLSENSKLKYEYSNLGAGLIGYTLSEIDSITYDSLLFTKIFSKYNMLNSTTKLDKVNGELVKGLGAIGSEVPNWEFSILSGAGGILSTVEDLSKFAVAQFDSSNKELKLTRKKSFKISDNMSIGLGWHIIKSKSGNVLNWHNGATGGYFSSMAIDVKSENGIIILSNVSAFNQNAGNIDKLCFKLMETLGKE